MPNELKIEEKFVVDGKTFYYREDAQEYIDDIKKERSKNEYHDTVYYENWTTAGEEAERSTCHARWQTYQEALNDMSNYANSWRSNGTGWILKVTISTDNKNHVQVNNERVYENM